MKRLLVSLLCGFFFGLGLSLSGMTLPSKVIGFLDIFGIWDPSLAFVMGGALLSHSLLYHFLIKKRKPLFEKQLNLPKKTKIDKQLILGSAIFGIGWAIAGYCPGPVFTSVFYQAPNTLLFILFMTLGSFAGRKTL